MLRSPIARRFALLNEMVAYRFAAAVTTVTPSLVARLERKAGASGKVRLLPNGVDLERFDPTVDPSVARRHFGWPEARLSLAYVGTVGLAQGLGTLMSAMAELQGSGIVLHVVGGGAQRSAMVDEIQRRQLGDIVFHDPVQADDVPAILAAADAVLVLLRRGPLYNESLPTKLVEGLAAGRPIIVSADGEAARIVRNSRAGSVAPAEDATALAKAITQIRDARDRRAMGSRGRALAETEYARAAIVERLAAILATAAGRGDDRSAKI
jgi:glycosyltransferase involved in cell wall biosynthesis